MAKGTDLTEIYYMAKQHYDLPTALIQTARDIAKERYKSYTNNKSNPHFPHFSGFMLVRLDHRSISFKEDANHFKMWANISTIYGKVKVPITSCEEYIDDLKNNRFKAVQLKYNEKGFYLYVIFENNRTIPSKKKFEYFVGVDRGINNIATIVVQNRNGNIFESRFFSGKQVLEKRRRYSKLRRHLDEKRLWMMLRKNKGKERNYIKDINHKISSEIIDIAKKYPNAVIVLENLKGIRDKIHWSKEMNKKAHSWAFREFEKMIVYKAHDNSIAVRRVHPRGTSSTCKNCFGKVKRSPSARVVCETCKKEYNADWLGAVNITRRFFSYMLKDLGCSESNPRQGNIESECVTAPDHPDLVAHLRRS
jgi:IS605 OrfB family transposase